MKDILHDAGFDEWWKRDRVETGFQSPLFDFDTHTSSSEEFLLPRKIWCNLIRIRT